MTPGSALNTVLPMLDVGKIIREARKRLGLSQEKLGELVGVTRSAVNQWESGKTTPESDKLPELARILKLAAEEMLGVRRLQNDSSPATKSKLLKSDVTPLDRTIALPHGGDMPRDLPIRGTVSGGPGGFQMANGDAMDWVRRPPRLAGRTDVFGLYVEDTSMSPRYDPGALVIVEKARPPSIGDDVVFELLPETARDERRALIKRLVAQTPTLIRVEQFNPAKILEFPRKRIASMLRVMTLTDLFGI